ncbi:hypothetical protein O8C83_05970 [Aliarcobacter butzleri]|uniref:hypothetical protein n=1 Tax=Aliarcobacter butzleri TaxID=28197 RepID=UPI00263E3353|nr:hypothetical protein [Aliarcobacter butzleri]MDN5100364.1 hypothetical protein [Aliarcobacter butzleri]
MKNISIDGVVDSVKYRLVFIDKNYRDKILNDILTFVSSTKLVHIKTDEKASNEYCQVIKLRSSNTTIASITTSTFCTIHDFQNINNYYIAIAFHGLVRYQKKLDAKSKLLLQHITAYLNTKKLPFIITQFDISTDIKCPLSNLVAVCVNRKSRKKYHPLGTYDDNRNKIQKNEGTYEIEKFESKEKRNNVMKLAYLYNKRRKEIMKANYDIGYEVSRFEMKCQTRFFLDKEVSVRIFLQELKDYKLFYFKDMTQKDEFTKRYNKANNKYRNQLIDELSMVTPEIITNMIKIEEFLRVVDTIKFDEKGHFFVTPKENYIIGTSRLNTTTKK